MPNQAVDLLDADGKEIRALVVEVSEEGVTFLFEQAAMAVFMRINAEPPSYCPLHEPKGFAAGEMLRLNFDITARRQ